MKGLVIIPARGGSKGIPNKNIRFLSGKPLIFYSLNTANNSTHNLDIIVSTESSKIKNWVNQLGYAVIDRPNSLSSDEATLDEVITSVYLDNFAKSGYDFVVTIQPTSPLLTSITLDRAINEFINCNYDTLISVVNHPHLSWRDEGSEIAPNYLLRKNRQELPNYYLETGAFVISRSSNFENASRISGKISVFEIPNNESIDIDDYNDWILAEKAILSRKIVIFTEGYSMIGMGHVYRTLLLFEKLFTHEVTLITTSRSDIAIEKFQEDKIPHIVVNNCEEFLRILPELKPDILINDILDTTVGFIKKCKTHVSRVINFEDLGKGGKYCDVVINDLYEYPVLLDGDNYLWGSRYFLLRDEFFLIGKTKFSKKVTNILVLFGGTDPSNLNKKLSEVAVLLANEFKFTFIVGKGYKYYDNLYRILNKHSNITLTSDTNQVASIMKTTQLAISSQGRTMLELAFMQIPTILLAQNNRELKHSFGYLDNGFINLGLGKTIKVEEVYRTIKWLASSSRIREELRIVQSRFKPENTFKELERIILG